MDYALFRHGETAFAVNCELRSKWCNKNVAIFWRVMHIESTKAGMKYSEFRRWLRGQGATFVAAKGSHFKVTSAIARRFSRITALRKLAKA